MESKLDTRLLELAGVGLWVSRPESRLNDLNGRGGGIRTPDPLLPKQMRYQATLRPDSAIVSHPDCSGVMAQPRQKPEQ